MSLGASVRRHRTAILGLTSLVAAGGLWAAGSMPVAIFPEIAFHRIGIIARAVNLPVEQTVTALTQPLENALSGVLGLDMVRSKTTPGGVEIDLRFDWNQDMLAALQLVQAAMQSVRGSLPTGTEIETRLLDTSAFPIVGVAMTSQSRPIGQLSDLAIYEVAPRLRTVPGVYRVELNGAKVREYALTVDPQELVAHRLDLATVEAAIREANQIVAAGNVESGHQLVLTIVDGKASTPRTLLDTVVSQRAGVPVRLGEVARIESTIREDFTRAAANGQTAVLLGVSRQPTGNTIDVSIGVQERIAALARAHRDVRFSTFYDQADLVHDAVASVRDAILIGLVLAVATILFFIADLRTTLVAAAVIPATLLASCLVMRALGMSFNLMTLGGIAAGIGLILDDAIVVVENFHRHRLLGEESGTALEESTSEIVHALVGSTLTPVAVLLPLALLGQIPGAFFRPLAVTMSTALLVSLVLAVTFTPALTAAIEPEAVRRTRRGPGDRIAEWLAGWYARMLRWILMHSWTALAIAAVTAVLGTATYQRLETGFMPVMDEGAFILDFWSPPGTSLEETSRMLESVDAILRNTPEVLTFSRRTGAELGFFLTATNRGDYSVRLRSERRRPIEDVIRDVRHAVEARVPSLRVEFVQILQDMIGDLSGQPEPVEIKLFSPDLASLESAAPRVRGAIDRVDGIVDSFDGITPAGPTYRIAVDGSRSSLVGLSPSDVQHWLETAIPGTVVGRVLEQDRAIPLRLRYPDAFRSRIDQLGVLTLTGPQGQLAPLSSIAELETGPVAIERDRENLRQVVRVTARLEGRDLGSALADVRRAVVSTVAAGIAVEYGGIYASQQQAFADLVRVFCASMACVGALLLVEFSSLAAVAAIIIGSSLAVSGAFLALWLTKTAINVSSLVGMIMVLGIVAKNGILLIDFANRERARGERTLEDALIEAGRVRLRPILMTSLAAIAGLTPLALGLGAGGQMQQPLAIAILGGISMSMFFSLLAVPALLVSFTPRSWRGAKSSVRESAIL
jgi:CzcA family heavy metal efflux pump